MACGKIKKDKNTLENGKPIKLMAMESIPLKTATIKVSNYLFKDNLIPSKNTVMVLKILTMEIFIRDIIFMESQMVMDNTYGKIKQSIMAILSMA